MEELANILDTKIESRDANLVITNERVAVHFHPDDRGYAFISCKVYDESVEQILNEYINKYGV
jgi:hypothetical protein